jgi:hypothetical protein
MGLAMWRLLYRFGALTGQLCRVWADVPARPCCLAAVISARRAWRWRRIFEAEGLLALSLVLSLGGCSGSRVIDSYAADYRVTAASAGDSQLLLNILRAKDNLPIHFSDLSIIHGSIQWTAGASASIPIVQNGSFTPSTVSPSLGAQNSPTFDLGTLDTQAFTKGILAPIDLKIIKQFFDQGVDPRLMMLLFFSDYETADYRRYPNNMACDLSDPGLHPEDGCLNRVYAYLRAIDRIFSRAGLAAGPMGRQQPQAQLQANVYVKLKPVGGPMSGAWTLGQLSDLRQIDPAKFKLEGKQLYSISEPQLAICYERNNILYPLFDTPSKASFEACNKNEVKIFRTERTTTLPVRSTYEILQFLGQVLKFQQDKGDDRCVTLGADENKGEKRCDTGEVLFQVNAPVGTPVVATKYDDQWYALYDRPCDKNFYQACDYSLQVLAILELLLNANKIANDIPSTPRVQVVP